MELIAKVPPIPSKEKIVWCDGGDEQMGHPKVYINLVSMNCCNSYRPTHLTTNKYSDPRSELFKCDLEVLFN